MLAAKLADPGRDASPAAEVAAQDAAAQGRAENGQRGTRFRVEQELIVLALAVVLFLAFAVGLPGFLTAGNLTNLVRNVSVLGILGVGMIVVIIGRGIDLSMVSNMAISIGWAAKVMAVGATTVVGLCYGLGFALAVGVVNPRDEQTAQQGDI